MIERIKIVKSDLEKLFDKIAPDWRERTLYQWQYGEEHPEEISTKRLYDLKEYKKSQGGGLTIYAKGEGLIIEKSDSFGHTNVLTNVEPRGGFDREKELKEVTINKLNILYK